MKKSAAQYLKTKRRFKKFASDFGTVARLRRYKALSKEEKIKVIRKFDHHLPSLLTPLLQK